MVREAGMLLEFRQHSQKKQNRPPRGRLKIFAPIAASGLLLAGLLIMSTPCSGAPEAKDPFHGPEEVKLLDGPLFERRSALKERIERAESDGIGVKNYLSALKYVESMIKSGQPESAIVPRLISIERGLDEQYKRSRILKIQKLPPPIAASSPPPSASYSGPVKSNSSSSSGNLDSMLKNGNRREILEKIKNGWFGGDLPDSVKNKIPKGFDPSSLSKQDLDRLMKRLGK